MALDKAQARVEEGGELELVGNGGAEFPGREDFWVVLVELEEDGLRGEDIPVGVVLCPEGEWLGETSKLYLRVSVSGWVSQVRRRMLWYPLLAAASVVETVSSAMQRSRKCSRSTAISGKGSVGSVMPEAATLSANLAILQMQYVHSMLAQL